LKRSLILVKNLALAAVFILSGCSSNLYSSNPKVFVVSDSAVYISSNGGSSYNLFIKGLPQNVIPLKLFINSGEYYLTTFRSGIFKLDKKTEIWQNISSPEFKRRTLSGLDAGYRKISALAFDKNNPLNIALATKHNIYTSKDGGTSWNKLNNTAFGTRNYVTALAVSGEEIIVGTSFNGIYRLNNGAALRFNRGLPQEPYSGDTFFTEQIQSIEYSGDKKFLYAGTAFGKGIFYYSNGLWTQVNIPQQKNSMYHADNISAIKNQILISAGPTVYLLEGNKIISEINPDKYTSKLKYDFKTVIVSETENLPALYFNYHNIPEKKKEKWSDIKALYASVPAVRRNLNGIIDSIKAAKLNAIVIDMKDDYGNIYFPVKNTVAKEINAVRKPVDVSAMLEKLKSNGIYSIARIVTFKDEKIYRAFNSKYAIKNISTGTPWKGTPGEYWVDPHSDFVQQYNIDLAKELEELGFDEIQYDYIRFPSDGPTHLCQFSFKKDPDMYKSEILTDFLIKAKRILKIPVSVDIYGFNSWYHFGNWIGQDMEEFSYIVNAISPMVYPSHFGVKFYRAVGREAHPYRVVLDGGKRAVILVNNRVDLRPYLQAFKMMSPTWGPDYINAQVKGALESGQSGYIFWNAKAEYQTVEKALSGK
jgi:hypothetical protein